MGELPIYSPCNKDKPYQAYDQQYLVLKQCFRWVAACIFHDAIHIPEQPETAERNRVKQARMGYDIHRISDQNCGAGHIQGPMKKLHRVSL